MNIHIITQNEPFYIPKMIKYIYLNKTSSVNITSFTIMKPHRKNKNMIHWINERVRIYNLYELLLVFIPFTFIKFIKIFKSDYSFNSQKIFKKGRPLILKLKI